MVFNPAIPEIATVTSESLQLKIRQLLPSQDGFGTDLAAQNVIVPIVDLTEAATGSDVPQQLQEAINFGGITAFEATNGTVTIANTAGFYRVFGMATSKSAGGSETRTRFDLSDGATDKTCWNLIQASTSNTNYVFAQFDFIVFLDTGDSLKAVTTSADAYAAGSIRQVADSNGTLVNPVGFNPQ